MATSSNRLIKRTASLFPSLKVQLRIAHVRMAPEQFIAKQLKFALPMSIGLSVFLFFILDKARLPWYLALLFFPMAFVMVFFFGFMQLQGMIARRQKEIDREVLFAGQYLLIKLYSGKPLFNALIESTKSYGVASKYIKEIVDDVDTGSPLERALANAMRFSPSDKFRKILFQINNALKLGIDVTGPLRSMLEEIRKEQEIEIKRYGRTLNSMVIFYMLAAIVIPSIGMTIFIVLSSFISLNITILHFIAALFFMVCVELIFIAVFKSIRPTVNI